MLFYILFTILPVFSFCQNNEFTDLKKNHNPRELTNLQVQYIAGLTNTRHLNELLDNICVPRTVGTKEHNAVHDYIVTQLKNLGWNVQIDSFEERTPVFGNLRFRNIIGTLNEEAERYLVLACHYDSKYFPNFDFQGATDSAVPCSMMLNLAYVMQNELKESNHPNLKLIFFDGEEAFKQWNKQDSIYGARHLADLYSQQFGTTKSGFSVNELNKIDVFILLDLIGPPNPSFYNYFRSTARWHIRLVEIENRLRKMNLLASPGSYFKALDNSGSRIEDDHTPFLAKGVPILHLIAVPFPDVWHTIGDNRTIVDIATVEHINQILRIFVAEYLHLSVHS